jgi:hypothetical protein
MIEGGGGKDAGDVGMGNVMGKRRPEGASHLTGRVQDRQYPLESPRQPFAAPKLRLSNYLCLQAII